MGFGVSVDAFLLSNRGDVVLRSLCITRPITEAHEYWTLRNGPQKAPGTWLYPKNTIFQGRTVSFAACNEKRLNVELLFPSTVTFITWMIIWIWQLTSLWKKSDYHHEWDRIKCKTPILQWTSVVPSELQVTAWYWTQESISQGFPHAYHPVFG